MNAKYKGIMYARKMLLVGKGWHRFSSRLGVQFSWNLIFVNNHDCILYGFFNLLSKHALAYNILVHYFDAAKMADIRRRSPSLIRAGDGTRTFHQSALSKVSQGRNFFKIIGVAFSS